MFRIYQDLKSRYQSSPALFELTLSSFLSCDIYKGQLLKGHYGCKLRVHSRFTRPFKRGVQSREIHREGDLQRDVCRRYVVEHKHTTTYMVRFCHTCFHEEGS